MDTRRLGLILIEQMEKLRQVKGQISVEDAGAIVAEMIKACNDAPLQHEIVQMVKDIADAKKEILSLSTNKQANKKALSDASLHLDTVIKSTEEATNQFLDAADTIQKLAAGIGGQKEKDLNAICTRIYEACNFQDLSSQRITKVIKLIQTLELHIANLAALFKIQEENHETMPTGKITIPEDERELLSGPQLPRDATSQEDVDSLFKSLKTGG